jgi:small subunit ribosomal protein S1
MFAGEQCMDSNMPGLGETEERESTSSGGEEAQPQAVSQSDSASTNTPVDAEQSASDAGATNDEGTAAEHDAPMSEEQAQAEMAGADEVAEAIEDAGANAAAEEGGQDIAPLATPDAGESTTADAGSKPAGESPKPKGLRGTVIEGTVIATSPTAVTVDIGQDREGIIPSHELEKMNKGTLDTLKEGEKVMVYVVNDREVTTGKFLLSINRAMEEMDWQKAEQYRQSQQVFETRVAGYNKGGLIVRFGRVRGFVPQSQMSVERRRVLSGETPEERWGKMVNEPISVKVMEVDRSRNRLILSERSASRESREKRKESLINQLEKGEVRTGRVVSLEDFGAFVDIGGAEGLVHLTELSWKHVTHPKELLQVGQEVKVEVISVDPDTKRIGLSMKRQEPDPWDMIAINYNVGQLVQGEVTKLTKFGAFARLVDVPEIEGLIHISELSDKRVNHPKEVVDEGDRLTLRVVKMDIANRRLGLSLKKVNSAEYLDQDWSSAYTPPTDTASEAGDDTADDESEANE